MHMCIPSNNYLGITHLCRVLPPFGNLPDIHKCNSHLYQCTLHSQAPHTSLASQCTHQYLYGYVHFSLLSSVPEISSPWSKNRDKNPRMRNMSPPKVCACVDSRRDFRTMDLKFLVHLTHLCRALPPSHSLPDIHMCNYHLCQCTLHSFHTSPAPQCTRQYLCGHTFTLLSEIITLSHLCRVLPPFHSLPDIHKCSSHLYQCTLHSQAPHTSLASQCTHQYLHVWACTL